MDKLPLVEIFDSWQGEGLYAGQRQIFVRFYNCNLKCSYCDEKNKKYKLVSISEIVKKIKTISFNKGINNISFTGGEPLLYWQAIKDIIEILNGDYNYLIKKNWKKNYNYLLETNGSLYRELENIINIIDVVSGDVKLPQYTNVVLWDDTFKFLKVAREKVYVKVVFDKNVKIKDFRKAVEIVGNVSQSIPLFLQPVFLNSVEIDFKLIDLLYSIASRKLKDVRFLPQIHKLINIR